jgi:hypothetical protein
METYNGYANYETWLVALWIDNDQNNIYHWGEIAKYHYDIAKDTKYFTKKEEAIISFAEDMKEWYEDNMPDSEEIGGLFRDMLHASLGCVDWHELAGKYMEQYLASCYYE